MRLLVTGAGGLLGLNLSLEAMRSHKVVGLDRGRLASPPFELLQGDLLEPGIMDRALETSGAEAVIHCAALADVDACETDPELARRLNAYLPGKVAEICARRGVQLVHISTDAVFDGASEAPYTEADAPAPTGVYAQTKLAGEQAVLAAHSDAIVARVNFYGWSMSGRRSLAEFFVNNLRDGRPIRGFTDVTFCPMNVVDLAHLLVEMLRTGLHGLYHAVGGQAMTKFDFGVEIARVFGFDEGLITAVSVERAGLTAKRAHNLHLSIHKLSTALGGPLPDFSTGLGRFFAQYRAGFPQQLQSYQQVQG